jgi:hypothetical protein
MSNPSPNAEKEDAVSALDTNDSDQQYQTAEYASEPPSCELVKIIDIQFMDIMCGRGGAANKHNSHFRLVVDQYKAEYLKSRKNDKREIAKRIVADISSKGGRFLRKVEEQSGGYWVQLDEKKAIEKTLQALREGLEVRKTSSGSNGSLSKKRKSQKTVVAKNEPQDLVVTPPTASSADDKTPPAPSTPSASPGSKRMNECDNRNANVLVHPSPLPYHTQQVHSLPPPLPHHHYVGYPMYPRGPYYAPYPPQPCHGQYPPPPYPFMVYGPQLPPPHHNQPSINPDMILAPPNYTNYYMNQTTGNGSNLDNINAAANNGNHENMCDDKREPYTTAEQGQKVIIAEENNESQESAEISKSNDKVISLSDVNAKTEGEQSDSWTKAIGNQTEIQEPTEPKLEEMPQLTASL